MQAQGLHPLPPFTEKVAPNSQAFENKDGLTKPNYMVNLRNSFQSAHKGLALNSAL